MPKSQDTEKYRPCWYFSTTDKLLWKLLLWINCRFFSRGECFSYHSSCVSVVSPGVVSLKPMTSQFKDILNYVQTKTKISKMHILQTEISKMHILRCMVQNFMWNFKDALWNFARNFEPVHRKIYILRDVSSFTNYDICELWQLKS